MNKNVNQFSISLHTVNTPICIVNRHCQPAVAGREQSLLLMGLMRLHLVGDDADKTN